MKYFPLGESVGRCKAGNFGLQKASGNFINFLDDDDLLYPDHVEVLIQAIVPSISRYKAVYSASFKVPAVYGTENVRRIKYFSYFKNYDTNELKRGNLFPIQAVLFHRSLYDSLGGLDESINYLEDWDLWLKYSRATDFLAVEKTTSEFRVPNDKSFKKERQKLLNSKLKYIKKKYQNFYIKKRVY